MSLPKKAAFYAILALVVVAAAEMVSSAFLFFAYRDQISSLSGEPLAPSTVLVLGKGLNWLSPGSAPDPLPYRRMTRIPQDFFAEDAAQGYLAKPGRYVFRYTRPQGGALEHLDSVVTITGDGTRFTGNAPSAPARQIHVLGDSFVFGDGVNDEQTFSFLLQSPFPRYAVHLHALTALLVGDVHDEADRELVSIHVRAFDLGPMDLVRIVPPFALGAGGRLAAALGHIAHRFDAEHVVGPVFLAGLVELALFAQRYEVVGDFLSGHWRLLCCRRDGALAESCDRNWQQPVTRA